MSAKQLAINRQIKRFKEVRDLDKYNFDDISEEGRFDNRQWSYWELNRDLQLDRYFSEWSQKPLFQHLMVVAMTGRNAKLPYAVRESLYKYAQREKIRLQDNQLNLESIEFIGDAILNVVALEWIKTSMPKVLGNYGEAVKVFRAITSNRSLALLSRSMGICTEKSFTHLKRCADRIEAIIGVIYLFVGMDNIPLITKWYIQLPQNVELLESLINREYLGNVPDLDLVGPDLALQRPHVPVISITNFKSINSVYYELVNDNISDKTYTSFTTCKYLIGPLIYKLFACEIIIDYCNKQPLKLLTLDPTMLHEYITDATSDKNITKVIQLLGLCYSFESDIYQFHFCKQKFIGTLGYLFLMERSLKSVYTWMMRDDIVDVLLSMIAV